MTQDATDKILGSFRRVLGEGRAADTRSPAFGQAQVSDAEAGRGTEADAAAPGLFRDRVCAAHGVSVEGLAQGIWQRQRDPSAFSAMAPGGFLSWRLWRAGLAEYDEMEGIAWDWQSVDGAMVKAPWPWSAWGRTPRIGEKNGRKRSLLVDGRGVPLSLVASGANVHDVKLLAATLDQVIRARPAPRAKALSISAPMRVTRERPLGKRWRTATIGRISNNGEKRRRQSVSGQGTRLVAGWWSEPTLGSTDFASC